MLTIAFDLDDTLYDRTQPLRKSLLHFEKTKDLSFENFYPIFEINREFAFEKVKERVWSLEESYIYRIQETLRQLGIDISDKEALSFQEHYEYQQQHIELLPHIEDILAFLQREDIQTFIITNGPSNNQRNKIKNLGLENYFRKEQVIVSGEEGVAKPDVRIFEVAEKRFPLEKKQTWFIGDSYENDIVGAHHAGWNSIWLKHERNNESMLPQITPTKTFTNTKDLQEFIVARFK